MLWRRDSDWTYELFSLDENPEEMDRFSSILTLWRSKCKDGKLPKWADFDLLEFKDWWGWVMVLDFEGADKENIRVRLWGTKVTDFVGFDLSGKLMGLTDTSGIVDAQHITDIDIEFHHTAAKTEKIAYLHGPVKVELKDWQYMRECGLPLADDGENVDKLLYVVHLEEME